MDYPSRPEGNLYCRVPQDSPFNVRGARNIPCATKPGKRAPTVAMCESDENYVPLNDGYNWKRRPQRHLVRATHSAARAGGHPAPPTAVPPPIAIAQYDPNTGTYLGPDGQTYRQTDLARDANQDQSWQAMLLPPKRP